MPGAGAGGAVEGAGPAGRGEGAPFVEPVGRPFGRIVLAVAVLGLVVAAFFLVDLRAFSLSDVQAWVQATGIWAPLVYVVVFVGAAVLVVPGTLMLVVAGLLFPLWWALGLAWLGSWAAACAAFVVGRTLGRRAVARLVGERLGRLDARIAEHGFRVVLVMRLAGLPPYNVLNYASGLTRVRFVDYAVASAIGLVPLVVAVVVLTNRIGTAPTLRDVLTDPVLYVALALVVIVLLGARALRRRTMREGGAAAP